MLSTSIHAQPGVYALLLGSGVSTGQGIPTGWGVVTELVRRAAVAKTADDADGPLAGHAIGCCRPVAFWAVFGNARVWLGA